MFTVYNKNCLIHVKLGEVRLEEKEKKISNYEEPINAQTDTFRVRTSKKNMALDPEKRLSKAPIQQKK